MMRPILKPLLVLAALDALGGVGLWYGSIIAAENKTNENTLRSELATENEKNLQQNAMEKMLAQAKEEHHKLEHYLFSGSEVGQIAFLTEFEHLGKSVPGATMTIDSFDYIKNNPTSFRGTANITGTYAAVYRMIRLMEEYPSRFIITRLEFKQKDTLNKADEWSALLAFTMFGVTQ